MFGKRKNKMSNSNQLSTRSQLVQDFLEATRHSSVESHTIAFNVDDKAYELLSAIAKEAGLSRDKAFKAIILGMLEYVDGVSAVNTQDITAMTAQFTAQLEGLMQGIGVLTQVKELVDKNK